jgi:acyl-CoA synthetase (AMP-forming)/AMP-acid ligase II
MAGHRHRSHGGEIGKRLLPVIIDEVARDDPDRAWASLPIDDYDLSQGFEDITYAAFANGINKLAHCIAAAFGRSKTFETIIYLGIPDIRYYMLLYAVCKTGHKVLFSSHMNTIDVHFSLMDQTNCKALLLARGVYVDDILAGRPMPKAVIPELDDLLDLDDVAAPFTYTKTFAEAQKDPFAVCHTTGTTGEPKPVSFTHGSMATMDIQTEMPGVDGRGHWNWQPGVGTRYFMVASPFHSIAVVLAMTVSAFGGGILIPGFRHRPVNDVDETCDIIKHSGVTAGFMPSFVMDAIARRPDAEELIKRFNTVSYGNGKQTPWAIRENPRRLTNQSSRHTI